MHHHSIRLRSRRSCAALALSATAMLACSEVELVPAPPLADAGSDRAAPVGSTISLDGSGSRTGSGAAEGLTYVWTLAGRPAGSRAELAAGGTARPTLLLDVAGEYTAILVVREGEAQSKPDAVIVRAQVSLEIVSQTPPDRAYDVPALSPVILAFSQAIQPESIADDAVAVLDGNTLLPSLAQVSDGNTKVVLWPRERWPAGRELTVSVTQAVTSLSATSLAAAYRGRFRVATDPDDRAPRVLTVDPIDGSVDVAPGRAVVVDLDEPITSASATADADSDGCPDAVSLLGPSGCVVGSVSLSAGGTRLTFTPTSLLEAGLSYTFTVHGGAGGIADDAGNSLANDVTAGFTVSAVADDVPPRVLAVYPGDGYAGVPAGARLVVIFNEAMDAARLPTGTMLTRSGTPVPASAALDAGRTVLLITPTQPLTQGLEHTLTLPGGAAGLGDLAGIGFDGDGDGIAGGDHVTRFTVTTTPARDGVLTVPASVVAASAISVRLGDRDLDLSGARDNAAVEARSSSGEIEHMSLLESAGTTGIFDGSLTARFAIGPGPDDDGVIDVLPGDTIEITYFDALSAAGVPRLVTSTIAITGSGAGFAEGAVVGESTEAGGAARFSLVLTARPTADVIVHLSSSDAGEATVAPPELTFTSSSWNSPQSVTVTGVNDDVVDGDQSFDVLFGATTSADGAYAGIRPADVSLLNRDDDVASLELSAISGGTSEAGGTASFTVRLTSRPSAEVSLTLSSSDATEGTLSAAGLTFTSQNWSTRQTVTVTGVDDDADDGNVGYTVLLGAVSSSDADYAGIDPVDLGVTNSDDDTAGFTVSAVSGPTSELGGVATFTVALTSQPSTDVVVDFTTSLPAEASVLSGASLTFTSQSWATPERVALVGGDDVISDGDRLYAARGTVSGNAQYAALSFSDVSMTNTDDDVADLIIGRPSGPTTEGGGSATFTVALATQPSATVTIIPFSLDDTEGNVGGAGFIDFTTADWSIPQTVAVTGAPDALADGTQSYDIELAIASVDSEYAALAHYVTLANIDDEAGCTRLVINEVVTAPLFDWSDTVGGVGAAFDADPGSAAPDSGDEWIEIYNAGCSVDLTGYLLVMEDATPTTIALGVTAGHTLTFAGGSLASFGPGHRAVVGSPSSGDSMDDDLWVRLETPSSIVLDQVALGASLGGDADATNNAPSGASVGPPDEAVGRSPDRADSGIDLTDFAALPASPALDNDCGAWADVAVSASSSATGTGASLTWSHTVAAGAERALVVGVSLGSAAESVASVTYGGASLLKIGSGDDGAGTRAELWILSAPASGSADVIVTLSAATPAVAGAVSLTGVHQARPVVGSAFASGATFWANVSLAPLVQGALVVDVLSSSDAGAVGARQTERWSAAGGSGSVEGPERRAVPLLLDRILAGDVPWSMGAAAIAPACR